MTDKLTYTEVYKPFTPPRTHINSRKMLTKNKKHEENESENN